MNPDGGHATTRVHQSHRPKPSAVSSSWDWKQKSEIAKANQGSETAPTSATDARPTAPAPALGRDRVEIERQVSVRGKRTTPGAQAFAAKYRDDPRAIAEYLNDALSSGDPIRILKAIGDMVLAQGVTRFSERAGVRRDTLYRTFKGEVKPAFDTVMNVLTALDIQIMAKPMGHLAKLGLSKSAPSERLNAVRTSVSVAAGLKAKGK